VVDGDDEGHGEQSERLHALGAHSYEHLCLGGESRRSLCNRGATRLLLVWPTGLPVANTQESLRLRL
jgi:hypothetical protein